MKNKSKDGGVGLYFTLLLWMLLPTVYMTVRTAVAGKTGANINVFGSIEWFDLIDESITAFLTVPLYYLLKTKKMRSKYSGFAYVVSMAVYLVFTVVLVFNMNGIASFMNQKNAVSYLTAESVAMLVGFAGTLGILHCILSGRKKVIAGITATKIAGYAVGDVLLVPKFGAVGSAWSDTIVNAMIFAVLAVFVLIPERETFRFRPDRKFLIEWMKRGLFSGFGIFLDNIVYALVVVRTISRAGSLGSYWIANNIIWGLMIPFISCYCELIKRARIKRLTSKSVYACIAVVFVWIAFVPFWTPYVRHVLMQSGNDAKNITSLLATLLPFYVAYAASAVIDASFIAQGRTWCSAVISVIVNIGYYGIVYLCYRQGTFASSLTQVAYVFGTGMVIHLVASFVIYRLLVSHDRKAELMAEQTA